eukprot:m.21104 g.21104  ORF g.21104 m.21104 type:complete len:257 (-) comp13257_c0_seq1:102-872(-)
MSDWWLTMGDEVQLLRKVTVVEAAKDRLPVYTLTFSTPEKSNGDLGVRIDYGDVIKVVVPNYKPKSFSMSAARPGEFDITCKVYPNGRASGYLDQVKIGGTIRVFATGSKKRSAGKHVGIIAFGVGITEAMPIAEHELEKPEAESVVLLWASRTMGDTFWHDKAALLKQKYGQRFKLVIVLSRDKDINASHYGRVTPALLRTVFAEPWGEQDNDSKFNTRFLTVGTKEMMKGVDAMLTEIGYHGGGFSGKHALLFK